MRHVEWIWSDLEFKEFCVGLCLSVSAVIFTIPGKSCYLTEGHRTDALIPLFYSSLSVTFVSNLRKAGSAGLIIQVAEIDFSAMASTLFNGYFSRSLSAHRLLPIASRGNSLSLHRLVLFHLILACLARANSCERWIILWCGCRILSSYTLNLKHCRRWQP